MHYFEDRTSLIAEGLDEHSSVFQGLVKSSASLFIEM